MRTVSFQPKANRKALRAVRERLPRPRGALGSPKRWSAAGPPHSSLAENHFELRSTEVVHELLAAARAAAAGGILRCLGTSRASSFEPTAADAGSLVLIVVDDGGLSSGARARFAFRLHDAPFLLDGTLDRLGEGRWGLSKVRLFSLDQRRGERLSLGAACAQLRWSAVVGGRVESSVAQVENLSHTGIAVALDSPAARLPREEKFPATLTIDGRLIPCLAEARHGTHGHAGSRYGVHLHTQHGRSSLLDVYLRRRFPALVPRSELDADRVYDLLQSSGYLALREGMQPERGWLGRSDDQAISRDVCYRAQDGTLVGHVSFTRAYPRAWLGHQLATLRHHPEALPCRKEIYLHIAAFPTLVDGDDAMMVGYFDRSRPWHRRFFQKFIDWLSAPESAVTFALDRFERKAGVEPVAVTHADVEVAPLRPDESGEAAAIVRSQLPPLIAEALDIHPERLSASTMHENYESTRYARGRSALTLRVHGRLAGVALCETGSRELSIFNLLNMAQIFLLSDPAPPPHAQLQLLTAVRAFYAARGEHNPMVVAPPGTLQASRDGATFLAETMGMIAWSARAMRQYENFIKYEFGGVS